MKPEKLCKLLLACLLLGVLPACDGGDDVPVEGDEAGECSDGVDNDQDGLTDCSDDGCAAATACVGDDDDTSGDDDTSTPTVTTVSLIATKDAMVRRWGNFGDILNYGWEPYNSAHAWTGGGATVLHRSLIGFDLSSLPTATTVLSATLRLFGDPAGTSFNSAGHSTLSGSNACWLARLTSDWQEFTVNWDTQPSSDLSNAIEIPRTGGPFEGRVVDVTAMVQTMVSQPSQSFGFHLLLVNESPYRRMVFASTQNPNASLHPALDITYMH